MADMPDDVNEGALSTSSHILLQKIDRLHLLISELLLYNDKERYKNERKETLGNIKEEREKISYIILAIKDETLLSNVQEMNKRVDLILEQLKNIELSWSQNRISHENLIIISESLFKEIDAFSTLNTTRINQARFQVQLIGFTIGFTTILLIIILGWSVTASIIRTLRQSVKALTSINLNHLDKPLSISMSLPEKDEMGQMIYAMDDMRVRLLEGINERERQENELKQYRDHLEEPNQELKRLDQIKDEFLANTSHEIRTPLHGIITSRILN